jgi:tRNA-splicing ligase RtcB (3'-phosphate/5'-hydroxy nucleic acid ligase)
MEYLLKEKDKEGIIFVDKGMVDSETMKQIRSMIRHEAIKDARIMPDCHKGVGCCIGFTSKIVDKIVPNFVGGDIGCGIVTYPLELEKPIKPKQLDKHIHHYVPTGNYLDGKHIDCDLQSVDKFINRVFKLSNDDADNFSKFYKDKFNIDISKQKPHYCDKWFEGLCKKIKVNKKFVLMQLGTLGGGNHFIEVNKSEKNGKEYITVHSGSRGLGQHICRYHQDIITKGRDMDWDMFDEKVKKFSRNCKEKKKVKEYKDNIKKEMIQNKHPDYLIEEEAFNYYFDMIFAQKYALVNREIMIERILMYYNLEFNPEKKIESIHNYIDFNDFILRKGAINAHKDTLCLIALNMRDGILLCKGKGNEKWNNSSAHGSGRIITRQKAKKNTITIVKRLAKDFEEYDIYSSAPLTSIVDEAPECYKETDMIKELIEPSVEILEQLKPILNIKGI